MKTPMGEWAIVMYPSLFYIGIYSICMSVYMCVCFSSKNIISFIAYGRKGLVPVPADIGQEVGYAWMGHKFRADIRIQTTVHVSIQSYGLFRYHLT